MERAYNFSAGPSMMPVEILQQAKENLVSYPGAGCSVMEMSHRSVSFEKMIADAEESLRGLCIFQRIMRFCFCRAVLPCSFPLFP